MRSYIKTLVFAIIILFGIWYLSDSISALDVVKKPELIAGLAVLLIALIFNGKITNDLRKIRYEKLTDEEKLKLETEGDWLMKTYKKLLGSKPIEEEHEIILDHNYDGIKELDNDLPPWWKYGFYISIVFAIAYMFKYHVFNGDTQIDELNQAYVIAKKEIEEYKKTAKNLVDFNTVEVLAEESDLKKGKAIFEMNCVACHKADGGGGIGPNLTDEYWILGGGIKNVFKTVSEGGRDGKGMIAWKQSLKPLEIAQVSSYLLQFQGTTPAEPKAAEGEIWNAENEGN